ncbi:HAD domain-containing protein [Streptomyces sp. NPDC091972]|uniref:HAD domain-containing protein n=1 Tax=Streptomyces sp. NPDC091972 TaxID=3366007 RepID=UPI003814D2D5
MLLFLDVDGTLLPFGAAGSYPLYEPAFPRPDAVTGRPSPEAGASADHPLLPRVNPALGARLTALGCALVWATTWGEDADTVLAPWLGLPRLPCVEWPDPAGEDDEERTGLHWKTRPLVAWAAGRPFVWVDDEITDADRAWVAAQHPERALLHRVEHQVGIGDGDFAVIEEWLAGGGR